MKRFRTIHRARKSGVGLSLSGVLTLEIDAENRDDAIRQSQALLEADGWGFVERASVDEVKEAE